MMVGVVVVEDEEEDEEDEDEEKEGSEDLKSEVESVLFSKLLVESAATLLLL